MHIFSKDWKRVKNIIVDMDKKEKILNEIWSEFNLSLKKGGHPFHIFSISTINNNKPDARNVVLRNVEKEKRLISFHTDLRSKKINQIKNDSNVCALFYDKDKKIQIRLRGIISIEKSKETILKKWNALKPMSKKCYINKCAPGEVIKNSKDYLFSEENIPDIESGKINFSIINIKIDEIDWLNLSHKGHERMIISFFKKETHFNWVAP